MDIGHLREDYRSGELRRRDLAADPFVQFDSWFRDAQADEAVPEPNAMTLATADEQGAVSARTVLLKAWDAGGFVFFTNYESAKAAQISRNAQVALLFTWLRQERQIAITGRAARLTDGENAAYFSSRPVASQLGAWASHQSSVVPSRTVLEERFAELERQYAHAPIPRPAWWGGYRVIPATIEFWQGRSGRLHDRFRYTRQPDGSWPIDRLSP